MFSSNICRSKVFNFRLVFVVMKETNVRAKRMKCVAGKSGERICTSGGHLVFALAVLPERLAGNPFLPSPRTFARFCRFCKVYNLLVNLIDLLFFF